MARQRMCVLYDQSAKYGGLVAGTGNKSELMVGYVTVYGDGACAFEPLGHLYKTEVYRLAELLGLPRELIDKAPTADLWAGQTDEGEMGMSYEVLDELLYLIYEKGRDDESLVESGYLLSDIIRTQELYRRSEFKRNLPPQLAGIENEDIQEQ
jgi:NAD+ synthase